MQCHRRRNSIGASGRWRLPTPVMRQRAAESSEGAGWMAKRVLMTASVGRTRRSSIRRPLEARRSLRMRPSSSCRYLPLVGESTNVEPYMSTSCVPDQTREATAGAMSTRRRMSGPPTSGGGMKSLSTEPKAGMNVSSPRRRPATSGCQLPGMAPLSSSCTMCVAPPSKRLLPRVSAAALRIDPCLRRFGTFTCPQRSMLSEPTSAGAGRRRAPNSQNVQKMANTAPAKKVASVARASKMKRARRRVRLDAMAKHLEAMPGTGCGLGKERSTSKERTRASRAVHCSAEC